MRVETRHRRPAPPLYARALVLRERVLGPEHPDTAQSLNNLAVNAYYQDDLPAAERLMIQALHIRTARLGPDHPDTQSSRRSLAAIQQRLAGASPQPPSDPTAALAPLLAAIARIAAGDNGPRAAVEQSLAQLEQQGGMLRGPVAQIWQGKRDRDALVEGLDAQDTLLVERILELTQEYEAAAASIAELRIRAEHAVAQALAGDDVAQRAAVIAKLEILAQRSEREPIDPLWQELAAYLRELAAQLKQP